MKINKFFSHFIATAVLVGATSVAGVAQAPVTSGSQTITASASNYVDLTAGGNPVLSGNVGGDAGSDVSGTTINSVSNLGEVGPSNTNSLVRLQVPIRVRSNVSYVVSMAAVVTSNNDTRGINASDIGFGVDDIIRSGTGVAEGIDEVTAAMPTTSTGAADGTSGRWMWNEDNRLSNWSSNASIFSGSYVLDPVPVENTSALRANTYFAIKPQFFQGGSSTSVAVTYTISVQP
jgi:hypothetical protein